MHCYTQCPQPGGRPPPTHASAGDSWTPAGNLGQSPVGSLLLSPGSQCTQGSVCARVYFPVLCKFWQSCGGVNGNLLQEGLHHTHVCCTQSPRPCGSPLLTCTSKEMLRHSSISVSVGSLGPGAHKVCLSPLSISGGYGV